VGSLTQAGAAVLKEGGKAARARWAAVEAVKIAAGVAIDESGLLDEVERRVYQATGVGPESKEVVAGLIGALRAAAEAKSKKFTSDQQAVIDLAKNAKRRGVTRGEAETLIQWGKEYGLPVRGPESHPGRKFKDPHLHIGPVDHIPIVDDELP
jgi:hypothetical protein